MNPESLRESVKNAYSAAASRSADKHAFPVGRQFAASLGYGEDVLDSLPTDAVDAFAGVSHVPLWADIPSGSSVLDLGCGAGMDTLIAARRVGPAGRVIGVDFSVAMLARAQRAAVTAGARNVEFRLADAEQVPLESASMDVAIVNGIFNLNPHRASIFSELARVIRPGGSVFAAELILREPLSDEARFSADNWFA